MNNLNWTGERIVPLIQDQFGTFEHLHRYALATEFCKDKIVMDIACGEGYGSNFLANVARMVIGVDISEEVIVYASGKYQKENLIFKVGNTSHIPYENNSIDVIVSFETIEHHNEHLQMFNEIKRVLKKDGILIISSPEKSIYSSRDPNNKFHIKELTLNELLELIHIVFYYTIVLNQRFVIGSLLEPLVKDSYRFQTFDGDFVNIRNELTEYEFFNKPFFNVIICSNHKLDHANLPLASFYNAYKVYERMIEEKENRINILLNSNSYRLGNFLISPFRFLLNQWRKFVH